MDEVLTLEEARGIIARAVEKARELNLRGTFVVVDEGGNVVSISRMEDAPPSGVGVSKAKAYIAAVSHEPTARFSERMQGSQQRFAAYQDIMTDKIFPGPGGMPIMKNGRVVGAISTGPGAGPFRQIPGVDPSKLMANGEPANAEDLIICHALQIPYEDQHPGISAR